MPGSPEAPTPETEKLRREAPYVGALLRVANHLTRQRSLELVIARGFTDLNPALLAAFSYPPPDAARPVELAQRANTTRQAMNYLLQQLESLGYMERRSPQPGRRRLVYLTPRGWQVYDAIWTAQRQIEAEWRDLLGRDRFEELMRTLRQLAQSG